jgi:hypothetical protein
MASAFEDEITAALNAWTGRVSDTYREFQARYFDDCDGFAVDCIDWSDVQTGAHGPTEYQRAIFRKLPESKRLAVRSLHGAGKTATSAIVVLWFALTRDGKDWKVITTAGAWRQLIHYLWPEIHKWARRLRWDVIGREPFKRFELLERGLKLATGEASAVASDQPAMIEGAHADHLLYLLDESKAIRDETFDAVEGAFSGTGESLALAVSTPGEPGGRFYEIHARKAGLQDWATMHVTLAQAVASGRVSDTWAAARRQQWGETSPLYQNRVLGNFASDAKDTLIPLTWIEQAQERWYARAQAGAIPNAWEAIGADIARGGDDESCFAPYADNCIVKIDHYGTIDTMQATGILVGMQDGHRRMGTLPVAVVDVIGVGAGVVDRLRELQRPVKPFNASAKVSPGDKDRSGELGFFNLRSGGWWILRESLDPSYHPTLALPPDDRLTGDLAAPKWRVVSDGKIRVEEKEETKKRIGRSPDSGDAVMQVIGRRLIRSTTVTQIGLSGV